MIKDLQGRDLGHSDRGRNQNRNRMRLSVLKGRQNWKGKMFFERVCETEEQGLCAEGRNVGLHLLTVLPFASKPGIEPSSPGY